MDNLISIHAICKMLYTTSRTLRYYEELGLIHSERVGENSPRKYTQSEVQKLRKILLLRSLDIPVNEIKELLNEENIIAALMKRKRKLNHELENDVILLNKLQNIMDTKVGGAPPLSPDDLKVKEDFDRTVEEFKELTRTCAKLIIQKDYDILSRYFEDRYIDYISPGFLRSSIETVTIEAGEMTDYIDVIFFNKRQTNAVIHCSLADVMIKFYFNEDKKLTGMEYLTLEQ